MQRVAWKCVRKTNNEFDFLTEPAIKHESKIFLSRRVIMLWFYGSMLYELLTSSKGSSRISIIRGRISQLGKLHFNSFIETVMLSLLCLAGSPFWLVFVVFRI